MQRVGSAALFAGEKTQGTAADGLQKAGTSDDYSTDSLHIKPWRAAQAL